MHEANAAQYTCIAPSLLVVSARAIFANAQGDFRILARESRYGPYSISQLVLNMLNLCRGCLEQRVIISRHSSAYDLDSMRHTQAHYIPRDSLPSIVK